MPYDKEIYRKAFDSWLKANIPKGTYSKAAKNIFKGHEDPQKAFRRRRNEKAGWQIDDLCVLSEYLEIDIPTMFTQIEGVYRVLVATKQE